MPLSASRFHVVTESAFPWEQDALDFVRERLPDHEPYHAWSNFEFIADDGSINEVDLLVLAPGGFFLVEIKSRPGVLDGDARTWTWREQGRESVSDNPLYLANKKAKRLISLLKNQRAVSRQRLPFLEPLVFCSAAGLVVRLQGPAATGVRVRDKDQPQARSGDVKGIVAELTRPASTDPGAMRVDAPMVRVLSRAMEQAGIRRSQKSMRVGDYELGSLLSEGPAYQDYDAKHVSLSNTLRRVRLYQIPRGATMEYRRTLARAAEREFQILEGINHPGILRALEYKDHERGPALVFEYRPDSLPLDQFVQRHGTQLPIGDRLSLVRALAEVMKYAHERRLIHRALGPKSVLVLDPTSPNRRVQVLNWQVGARESGTTAGRSMTATSHVEQLVEEGSAVYMAPEALSAPGEVGEYVDIFSLGALAYLLVAGQPPAGSAVELNERLRMDRGLKLSNVVDGAGTELQDLISFATHPDVSTRLGSVGEFLELLDRVEEELTRPEQRAAVDPTDAKPGDELPGRLTVVRRLGHGSTSVVYLVKNAEGKELALKVAAAAEHNDRLKREGQTLKDLEPHQHIVRLHEELDIAGHVALLMDRAGSATLAERLRADGPLHLELLERFGEHLLQTVVWLEQKGIPHRDIKPANIGVAQMGRGDWLHLVLFDFSLARTPLDAIRAGTAPYLDPFLSLRKPRRWDVAAERFAAAVTLYEMATGTLPKWGDGRSDPAVIADEVTLDTGHFDPDLRERMTGFFERALMRDPSARFDNAADMLTTWRGVFRGLAAPRREEDETTQPASTDFVEAAARASADTPLVQVGLSTRALNALERHRVRTAADLAAMPSHFMLAMPGVGAKTRREIRDAKHALTQRLRDQQAAATSATTGDAAEAWSIDQLAARLLPRRPRRADSAETRILARCLDAGWPTQTAVAEGLGITRARVSQVLVKARPRWVKDPALTALRGEIADLLPTQGGVMALRELVQTMLTLRGSDADERTRLDRASAVARAIVEAEHERAEPRFGDYRRGDVVFVAVGEEAADFASQLGAMADDLARRDPLLPPARVLDELQLLDLPDNTAVSAARLVLLSAAASANAAASSRLEIYPKGMPGDRALRLAQGALLGAKWLTVEDLRDRVGGRYPEAERLPDRPALDDLLRQADLQLVWNPEGGAHRQGAYEPRLASALGVSSSTTFRTRSADDLEEEQPEEVQRFDERLQFALKQHSFLVLGVAPKYLQSAERLLTKTYPVSTVSLDRLLIQEMKRVAASAGADWNVVRRADAGGPGSADWLNLTRLVGRALPAVEKALLGSERPVLLGYSGLLARYGRLDLFDTLQQRAGRSDGPPGTWVLIPVDGQNSLPVIDGHPLPVVTSSQWARIPEAWVGKLGRVGNEAR